MPELFNHPIHSIAIEIIHTIIETDHGDYHSWSMAGIGSSRNDEAYIRARAEQCIADLGRCNIPSHIVVHTYRTPFPKEW